METKPKGKQNEVKKARNSSDEEDDSSFIVAPAKSAFALLDVESGDESESESLEEVAPQKNKKPKNAKPNATETPEAPKPAPAKKANKKKEKKPQNTEDDDDLDRMIAELKLEYNESEKPVATSKKGKKQKGNKVEATNVTEKTESVPAVAPVTKAKASEGEKKEKKQNVAQSDDAKGKEQDAGDGKKKKGPNKAMVAIMQERLKLLKEEEERAKVSF